MTFPVKSYAEAWTADERSAEEDEGLVAGGSSEMEACLPAEQADELGNIPVLSLTYPVYVTIHR